MRHRYEYMTMLEYLTPAKLGGMPNFSGQPAQLGLLKAMQDFIGKLPDIIDKLSAGDGWQVNSHSLTVVDSIVIVSLLLQRPHKS